MKKIIAVIMISVMTMMLAAGCGDEKAESTFESWKPEDKSSEAALKMATIEGNYSLAKATYGERFSNIRFGCEYYIKDKLEKDSEFSSCGIDKSEKSGIVGVFFEKGEIATRYTANEGDSTLGGIGDLDGFDKNVASTIGFAPFEGKQKIKAGEKIYIAAIAEGDYLSSPEAMAEKDSTMKKNKKNWLIYCVFERKDKKEKKDKK